MISSQASPYKKQDRTLLYKKLDKLPGALRFGTLHPGTILIILEANSTYTPKVEKAFLLQLGLHL